MRPNPGDPAPDATVFAAPREPVRLSRYFGERPVILLFFPLAYSSVCTREMCTVAEDYAAYEQDGVTVLGISVDSPFVNQKFAEDCRAPFPILSDFNREATDAYGVRRELGGLEGVSERAAFVVDPSGIVRYVWVGEHPGVFPPLEEIREAARRAGRGNA
ncbi:MAG TPA: redoxin domain-containing protein [Longimicrobiales bacterium]